MFVALFLGQVESVKVLGDLGGQVVGDLFEPSHVASVSHGVAASESELAETCGIVSHRVATPTPQAPIDRPNAKCLCPWSFLLVERAGFEPAYACAGRFTVCLHALI